MSWQIFWGLKLFLLGDVVSLSLPISFFKTAFECYWETDLGEYQTWASLESIKNDVPIAVSNTCQNILAC
jgi:hypothetical protein